MSNQDASPAVQEPLVQTKIAVMVNLNRPWTVEDARQIAVALDRTVTMAKNGTIIVHDAPPEAAIESLSYRGLSVIRGPSSSL